jgi:endonuclease/exonuclease/phosphatase family metal-dependent hydrolase
VCPSSVSRFRLLVAAVTLTVALSCALPFDNPYRKYGGPDSRDIADVSCREAAPQGPVIRWIELEDSTEHGIITRWCATVGPPIIEDFTTVDTVPVDSLVMISWNVHVGGGDIVWLVEDLRSGALTGAPVGQFVLLLQEVHRDGAEVPLINEDFVPKRIEASPPRNPRADIGEVAEALGLWVFYVPSMRNGPLLSGDTEEDRGNAILSTRPLSDLAAIELPFEKMRRVPIAGTFEGKATDGTSWLLRCANVHLSNRSDVAYHFGGGGIVGRLRQARAVCEALPETPAAVAGDFNTWAPSAVERSIPLMRRHFPLPEKFDKRPTFAARYVPDRRIDYFFFRLLEGQTARYERLDERYGSDHYPLAATIRFVASAAERFAD